MWANNVSFQVTESHRGFLASRKGSHPRDRPWLAGVRPQAGFRHDRSAGLPAARWLPAKPCPWRRLPGGGFSCGCLRGTRRIPSRKGPGVRRTLSWQPPPPCAAGEAACEAQRSALVRASKGLHLPHRAAGGVGASFGTTASPDWPATASTARHAAGGRMPLAAKPVVRRRWEAGFSGVPASGQTLGATPKSANFWKLRLPPGIVAAHSPQTIWRRRICRPLAAARLCRSRRFRRSSRLERRQPRVSRCNRLG
jgi:hypothetical protein